MKDKSGQEKCYKLAIGYASRYLCSESRLLEYLEKKGCGEHAQQIINRLKEIGVLDEFRSCELLAESYAKKFGRFSIEQKLRKRGFSNEIIKQVLKKSSYESEFNTAVEIARTKLKKLESAHSKDIKNKLLRFLASRGFSIDVCLKAVSKAMAEFKENQED